MLNSKIITFLDLCKTRSYTKTADNIHITQPAVTQHIKYLENTYCTKLVYYKDKTVVITKQGKLLEEFARSMYISDKKLKKVLEASILSPTELAFATTRIIGEYILSGVLSKYLSKLDYEKMKMIITGNKEALNKLNLGEIDFVITDGIFRANDYKCIHLLNEETIAVCAPNHPLAEGCVDFSDLISERLIYRLETSEVYDNLEAILSEKGYSIEDFKKTMVIGCITTIKELVKHNAGITFLYKFAVQKELQEGSLVKINICNFNIYRDFYFVMTKERFFNDDALALLKYCKQFISDYLC